MPNVVAPHEAFEIHELLQMKNLCTMKLSSLSGMVSDPKLRVMVESDMEKTQTHIEDLRNLLQQSGYTSHYQS